MRKPSPANRRFLIVPAVFGALCVAALILTGGRAPASSGHASATEPLPTGCVAKGSRLRDHGPRQKRTVALTFDGGPTKYYTPRVLRKLGRAGVPATFFIRGQFIHGHAGLLRQEIRAGHELANHSFSHPHFPSSQELKKTNRLIRGATGFKPCLFRPPYGSVDSALVRRSWREGMLTITWDVDSWDSLYEHVSASTVYSRVVGNVRPGSIILMHDGEGSHQGTLKALDPILRYLRKKHYRLVTVSKLLGLRMLPASGSQ